MASLDSLPADQRAVLQLVLQRGRSYDEIAQLLSIDRTAVRQRALAALDALGPHTGVAAEQRALITDYLLGQLPPRVSEETRERLANSPSDRAWARVVASELAPLASEALPEIPVQRTAQEPAQEPETVARTRRGARQESGAVAAATATSAAPPRDGHQELPPEGVGLPEPRHARQRRSSRRGGALLLALGSVAALVVIIVLVIVLSSGGSSNKPKTAAGASTGTTAASTTSTSAKVLGQINLTPPTGSSKAAGIAEIVQQGKTDGLVIVAQGVTPNTSHNAYAVWLYTPPSTSVLLGFVNPGVGSNGRLSTTGPLPTSATRYKQLLVTVETKARPKQPGKIVLQGALGSLP